jgi:hypothetical protein
MISKHADINKFFEEIDGKHHLEAIHLAHLEATAVERQLLFDKQMDSTDYLTYGEYSETLKEFISYIRYSAKPKITDTTKQRLYHAYLDSIPFKI